MQKPKSGPDPHKHLSLFLGLPRTPTNVNDLFIQPYTPNHKDMHWNRLKKLVSLPGFWWVLVGWRPPPGNVRPETLFFDKMMDFQVCQFSKRQTPKNDEDPSKKSWKSWMWDQYAPENMKWKSGSKTKKLKNLCN